MLFENTNHFADIPAVINSGCIAEYNFGSGMKLIGYQANLISPHFEGNDNDQTGEPDLVLGSAGQPGGSILHSRVICQAPYFSNPRHPQGIRISGSIPAFQTLVHILPTIRGGVVDAQRLDLTVVGPSPQIING